MMSISKKCLQVPLDQHDLHLTKNKLQNLHPCRGNFQKTPSLIAKCPIHRVAKKSPVNNLQQLCAFWARDSISNQPTTYMNRKTDPTIVALHMRMAS